MKYSDFDLKLIHYNDRNKSYKANKANKSYYLKESIVKDKAINKETIAMNLFHNVCPSIVPKTYTSDEKNILICEWLEGYEWIEYDLDDSYRYIYNNVGNFLYQNSIKNKFEVLIKTLSNEEIAHLANVKKTFLSMYVSVYKLLKLCKITEDTNHAEIYKLLLDRFVEENKILIHGDLNRSNILSNNKDIKIVDYEFSTFSSLEFELGRLFASFIMNGLENYRQTKKFTSFQSNLINNMFAIFQSLEKANIDLILLFNYIGFYITNIVFYHQNNFTRIKNKDDYISYFLPFAFFFISLKAEKNTPNENTFLIEFIKKFNIAK